MLLVFIGGNLLYLVSITINMNKTPLYDDYVESGAKMVNFGGWEMPLVFSSITKEHSAVRNNVGIFDVSHMGEIYLKGERAIEFISEHCTMNITKSKINQLKYAHMLNEEGGILDDMIVTRLSEESCYIVPNAGRTPIIYKWLVEHDGEKYMQDLTGETVMIAVQGPDAVKLMDKLSDEDVSDIKFFNARTVELNKEVMKVFDSEWSLGDAPLVQRSGYTGEDGFEVVLTAESGKVFWEQLLSVEDPPLICGLGARDTLRLEFGFLLSGQDFNETRTTVETGWTKMCVEWKHDFVGKDKLKEMKEKNHQLLKGILMVDKGIPRNGYDIFDGDQKVGQVTSGTRSISLKKGIALGYLDPGYHDEGTEVQVDIRGKKRKAKIKNPPFL